MRTDWREQLKAQVHEIRERFGPKKSTQRHGIVLSGEMSESELNKFSAFKGWCNDSQFGDAEPGTIEIRSTGRDIRGEPLLFFFYQTEPLASFCPSHLLLGRKNGTTGGPELHPGVDFNTIPEFAFASDRKELDLMKTGKRNEALVPITPLAARDLKPGTLVTFLQASGEPGILRFHGGPFGDFLTVKLTEVEDLNEEWGFYRLHQIKWDPEEVVKRSAQPPLGKRGAKGSRKGDG